MTSVVFSDGLVMAGFDFDHLRSFAAVADCGSLSAAAPRLCLSQSSVSEQIRKLEHRAGTALFLRSKAGVTLTPAGEKLLGYVQRILALDEAAYLDLRGCGLDGELRLFITDYFRPAEVARVLSRLNRRHPRLRLAVTIRKSAEVEVAANAGECDIGIFMRLGESADDETWARPLRREALSWVAGDGFEMNPAVPLPLVALPDTCSLHQFTVRSLNRDKIAYRLAHSATGVAGLRMAVTAGLGVACLNQSALDDGMIRLGTEHGLPELADARFYLSAPRVGEAAVVSQAREILAAELS